MSRTRVRRSFTVETKSRGRQAPAFLPVRASLLESAPKPRPEAGLFESRPEPAAARHEPRRILPNLIVPPVAEPEPEPVTAAEPPLPRVRRVKQASRGPTAPRSEEIRIPVPPVPARAAPVPVPPSEPRPAEIGPRPARRPAEGLRRGERWKRRLPRVCW